MPALKLSDIKKPFIKAWKIKFGNGALLEMDPNQPRVLKVPRHDFGCGRYFRLTFTAKTGSVRLQYDDLTCPEGLYAEFGSQVTFACHDGDCMYKEHVDVIGAVNEMLDTWTRFLDVFAINNINNNNRILAGSHVLQEYAKYGGGPHDPMQNYI
jgi:hypothetical protein